MSFGRMLRAGMGMLAALVLAGCVGDPYYWDDYRPAPAYPHVDYFYWHSHDGYHRHRHDRRHDHRSDHRHGRVYYGDDNRSWYWHDHDGYRSHRHDRRHDHATDHRQRRPDYGDGRSDGSGYRRDWRQGDGDFQRRARTQDGVPLEERTRRDRQERSREARRDRTDDAIQRRDRSRSREEIAPANPTPYLDGRTDRDRYRQQRASEAERAAQERAGQRRRELRQATPKDRNPEHPAGQEQRQKRQEGTDPDELLPGTAPQRR